MNKKIICSIVMGILCVSLISCSNGENATENNKQNEKYKKEAEMIEDCNEYSLEKYMKPYWEGDVIYNESVLPLKNAEGKMEPITLMYDIGAIVSVKNSALQKVYEEGKDYILEDGKLEILTSGSIPTIDYDFMYPSMQYGNSNPDSVMAHRTNGYMYFSEGSVFHYMQLAVTYIPKGTWEGPVPKQKSTLLKKTMEKLTTNQDLKVIVYGDSISVGANSSKFVNAAPYCENYFEMVVNSLTKDYGSKITFENPSVGGVASKWGVENAKALVADKNPDLVIVAFGMNDGSAGVNTEVFKNNIVKIIDTIKTSNPDCEFILVAPMIQNKDWPNAAMQAMYLEPLNSLEQEGCVVADVTSVHEYLLTRKRYVDMTGNHVNHPNDFLVRLYAQVIFELFQ